MYSEKPTIGFIYSIPPELRNFTAEQVNKIVRNINEVYVIDNKELFEFFSLIPQNLKIHCGIKKRRLLFTDTENWFSWAKARRAGKLFFCPFLKDTS